MSSLSRLHDNAVNRPKSFWMPHAGAFATYMGRSRHTVRNVRVIAESSAGRMVVEAIGKQVVPVRFTVKRENLKPLPQGLFD